MELADGMVIHDKFCFQVYTCLDLIHQKSKDQTQTETAHALIPALWQQRQINLLIQG